MHMYSGRFLTILLGLVAVAQYAIGQEEILFNKEVTGTSAGEAALNGTGVGSEAHESGEARVSRDPFWPIGYVPPEPDGASDAQESAAVPAAEFEGPVDFHGLTPEQRALIKSQMTVGGILKQRSGCIAIINNQLLKQGDSLVLEAGGQHFEFLVKSLTPERVLLEASN